MTGEELYELLDNINEDDRLTLDEEQKRGLIELLESKHKPTADLVRSLDKVTITKIDRHDWWIFLPCDFEEDSLNVGIAFHTY